MELGKLLSNPAVQIAVAGAAILVLLLLYRSRRNRGGGARQLGVNTHVARAVRQGNYEEAARLELQAGHLEPALDYYLRAQKPGRAAHVAQRLGRPRRAAELYERAGDLPRAASLFREAGMTQKADELLASVAPAASSEARGADERFLTPLDRANRAELAFRDARVKAQRGEEEPARVEQLGREAAEALLAAGEPRRAAETCREAGLVDQAINLYVNLLGDPGSAAPLLAERGDHKRAAELYEAAGEKERSLQAWIAWSHDEPNPLKELEAVSRLGDAAVCELLDTVVRKRPATSENLELHYRIAAAYEERSRPEAATPVLERVIAIDPQYRDASERVAKLRVVVASGAERAATPEAVARTTPALSLPAADAADPAERAPERLLDRESLERLVSEVAAAAASQAAELTRSKQISGSVLAVPVPVPADPQALAQSAARTRVRGLEQIAISLQYVSDSAVEAARRGPSLEELRGKIGGRSPAPENAELYYQLGLAQLAVGQWLDAQRAFEAVEQVKPGHADAAARAKELGRWRQAVGPTLFAGAQGDPAATRYTLLGEIGRGGMAVVFRARDEALDREVALKFLSEEVVGQKLMLDLFQREARAAAQLNHPNIVTIYDVGTLGGRAFICMELVSGVSVEKLIREQGRLSVIDTLRIADQILAALEVAHGKQIVHRDIKPSNMMRSELGVTKLMDFGLAKSFAAGGTTMIAGTPSYMAPEQFTGKEIDAATDLFALGASLYEMLAGRTPFEGMQRDRPPARLTSLNPTVPKILENVIHRALELEKSKRTPSATEMRRPVQQILGTVQSYLAKRPGKTSAALQPSASSPGTKLGLGEPGAGGTLRGPGKPRA